MVLEKEDEVISEFLRAIGPWHNYVVIGGGYALIIYKLYLGDKDLDNFPVGTVDIDSLIPRKVPEISKKNISKHLHEAGFVPVFKNLSLAATEAYTKEINGIEVEIEFLTDSASRGDKNKNVLISGVVAQPLSYLTLSLETTIKFETYSGKLGTVVSPGAWMFHKGLTFTRRKSPAKIYKDLYGIWYVSTQLGGFSEQAINELHLLGREHPKWLKSFQDNLHNWFEETSPADWVKLESQDPSGYLKRRNFEQIIERLMQLQVV